MQCTILYLTAEGTRAEVGIAELPPREHGTTAGITSTPEDPLATHHRDPTKGRLASGNSFQQSCTVFNASAGPALQGYLCPYFCHFLHM